MLLEMSKILFYLCLLVDYDRLHFCPKEMQRRYFLRHFDLAEVTRLPMFLHCRNTGDDFANILLIPFQSKLIFTST